MFTIIKAVVFMFTIVLSLCSSSCGKKQVSSDKISEEIPFPAKAMFGEQNKILLKKLRGSLYGECYLHIDKKSNYSAQEGAWVVDYHKSIDSLSSELHIKKNDITFPRDQLVTQRNLQLINALRSVYLDTNIIRIEYKDTYKQRESAWIIYEILP